METNVSIAEQSNYHLKNQVVALTGGVGAARTKRISLGDLERMRIEGAAIPASKHGLEAICGASFETGAQ